jgi:hypothetical protein
MAYQLFRLPKSTNIGTASFRLEAGAKAYFYETGTTTLQNTYQDAGLLFAHTNPVVADSAGVFSTIYLNPALTYKLTLTKSDGTLIYTVDPVNDRMEPFIALTDGEIAAGVTPVDYSVEPGGFARYGAVGDDSTDDTAAIQAAIDSASDGMTIFGEPGATYKLTKATSLLASVYPVRSGKTTGEQPCLAVYQKTGLTIDGRGSTLHVPAHAQGCIDVLQSTGIKIKNFTIVGPGNFPTLDGTTGRGEKGIVGAGYYDASAVANGPARNNSLNTSAFTAGGYGGAFPQFGGGTAATWGTWNGGYKSNFGTAIFVDDGSTDIEIFDNEISGFNEDGIQVSSTLTESYGWAACGRVQIHHNYIHNCYNAGVEYHNVTDICIHDNILKDNGHPSAAITHTHIDPGYGVASNNGTAPVRVVIHDNIMTGNKRKGIDAHSVDTTIITGNIIEDSGYGIMIVNGSAGVIRNIICSQNSIKRIVYPIAGHGTGIYIEWNSAGAAGFHGNVVVSDNQIFEVGVPLVSAASFPGTTPFGIGILLSGTLTGAVVTGNLIKNSDYLGFIGLCIGFAGPDTITGAFTGNSIQGPWRNGLNNLASGGTNNSTVGNNIELTAISPTYSDGQTGISGTTDRHFSANNVVVPTGHTFVNGTASNIILLVNVSIVAGVVTYTTGFNQSRFVTAVASHANGIQITLATGVACQCITVSQTSASKAVVTAGSVTIDYVYTRSAANPLQIGLQAAGTDRAASACTGQFTFAISI